jgi:hypothetical protein
MTHYRSRLATVAFALSLTIACDKASEDQVKTTGAQVKANNEISAANDEAKKEDRAAKATESKTIAAANADFAKLRADYRTDTQKSLADLDRKVTALETRSTAGVDARLRELHSQRIQFDTDFGALDSATEATWDAQKAALDKKLSEMNAVVDRATTSGYNPRY